MTNHNPTNERIKRRYFAYLAEAQGHNEQTIDAVAKAIARFEAFTRYKDFKSFHIEQAKAFKRDLAERRGDRSGEPLSKATLYAALTALKRFFVWLAGQTGYKSRISYSDAEYFNLSAKETRIAKATRPARVPTLEQIRHVIHTMPATTDIEQRDRALIAFTILTGARDGAIASFKLRHIDLAEGKIDQDAREVQTKFSKSLSPPSSRWATTSGQWRPIGWLICALKSYGGWTIRCFRRPRSRLATISDSGWWAWTASTGATPVPSGPSSKRHLRRRACRISIRTALGRRWRCWADRLASRQKNTKHGPRTLATSTC